MRKWKYRHLLFGLATGLGLTMQLSVAYCLESGQSHYLKGYQDFLSGVLPAPGVMVRNDVYFYDGSQRSPLPQGRLGVDLQTKTDLLGVTVVTPLSILGGQYGFSVRFIGSHVDADRTVTTPIGVTRSAGSLTGVSDAVFNPFVLGWHSGNFHWIISTPIWVPSGDYEATRTGNTGRNFYSWAPQAAVTYLEPDAGWELSAGLVYLFNSENPATHVQSGEVLHVDFSVGKRIYTGVTLGLVGYAMEQVTPDSGVGNKLGENKSSVLGIGPGMKFVFNPGPHSVTLVAKYYREFSGQNTTIGDAASLSARLHF